jgi:subtilisin family serine protease
MKNTLSIIFILLSVLLKAQGTISYALEQYLSQVDNNEYISVNLVFKEQVDIIALNSSLDNKDANRHDRIKTIIRELSNTAKFSQRGVLQFLESYKNTYSAQIKEVKSFWIVNAINIKVRPAVIYELALRDDILILDLDAPIYERIDPVKAESAEYKAGGNTEPGLLAINAKPLWDLGYTGRNTILLSMDTGVWPDHPAISDNYLGNYFPLDYVWYGVRSPIPQDHASSSHGTHTTGTVLGLDPATGDTIGVAVNAMWIASDPVASSESDLLAPSDFMTVFEWVLDPDGNPGTSDDVPDVINNSWGYDYNLAMAFGACEMTETQILEVIETAGICSPFSAGNEGPNSGTVGFPAMLAFSELNIFSIGAVNGNVSSWPITDFSSRGPTSCIEEEGNLRIKPEVVAPGYSVRSASGHNDYAYLSGTSMSCPHVSGALLLLREAFPEASAYELKNALYQTAIDLGEPGEDNVYGRGMIDVYAAYQFLENTYTPTPPVNNDFDLSTKIIIQEESVLCAGQENQSAILRLYNNGTEDISNMHIVFTLNNDTILDAVPNGIILSGDSLDINIDEFVFFPGRNQIHATAKLGEEISEYNIYNNSAIHYVYVIQDVQLPYVQDFDTVDAILNNSLWYISNTDNDATWETFEWDTDNENRALHFNFYNYRPRAGQIDDALMPQVSLPDTGQIYLEFNYAYKKRMEYVFKDTLQVLISTDCGISFDSIIYQNSGEDMASVEGNASNTQFIPVSINDWDTVKLDLNYWRGEDVIIAFRAINDNGSRLYIDNIALTVEAGTDFANQYHTNPYILVYPNPAVEQVVVECSQISSRGDIINVYNISGEIVSTKQIKSNIFKHNLSFKGLPSGVYLIQYISDTYVLNSKIIVK